MTSATAGSALSLARSPFETVAANELTSWKLLTWVACTARSSLISGAWSADRVARAAPRQRCRRRRCGLALQDHDHVLVDVLRQPPASEGVSGLEVGVVVAPTDCAPRSAASATTAANEAMTLLRAASSRATPATRERIPLRLSFFCGRTPARLPTVRQRRHDCCGGGTYHQGARIATIPPLVHFSS